MDTPFQYQHKNYIILFCEMKEDFQKYTKDGEFLVRSLESKDEVWEDFSSPQIYIDEMNEEVFIQKCKKIIYTLSYQTERSTWIEYAKQYEKEIDISNDLQIISFEDLPKKRIEKKRDPIILMDIQNSTKEYSTKINLITYIRRMPGNDMYYQLQIKCILENYKHHGVKNILVVGMGVEDTFQKISYEKIDGKNLILINDDDDNISFMDLFTIANHVFQNEMVMILRSDTIFLQNDDLSSLWIQYLHSNKKIIALSRIERDIQGRLVRLPPQQTSFGGLEQDAWILKTPIDIKEECSEMIQKIDFNEKFSELYMNYFMKKMGYQVTHDSREYKILRICIHPDIGMRDLIKPPSQPLQKEKIEMIPDLGIMEMISMDQWIQMMHYDDEEIYEMKTEWMNRFYKKRL
jgi:hypothetical protein